MAALNSGPCEAWEPIDCAAWPTELDAVRDIALMAATEILWNRTKRRFGLCEITLRPCRRECAGMSALSWLNSWLPTWGGSGGGWGWPYPALLGGVWYNLGCGFCGDTCSCTILHQVQLPNPVAEVTEVKVDGVVLDDTAYRVDNWQWLVRLDGADWPLCQDLNLEDTEVGTWSVTATYGEVVPTLGLFAVNELGLQIAKACMGLPCTLNGGMVESVQRQGVNKRFIIEGSKNAPLGLVMSDRFINLYNPSNSGIATIHNMDSPAPRRVGT